MKILIMRFGPPTPVLAIHEALKPHFSNDPQARMFPLPGGVMSIFETSSTCEEVAASLKALDMPIPFFVMPLNQSVMNFPGLFEALGEVEQSTVAPSQPLTVNEILDKISASGIESLTVEERATLERGA